MQFAGNLINKYSNQLIRRVFYETVCRQTSYRVCQSVSHHMQTSYRVCQSVNHHMQTSYRVCQSVNHHIKTSYRVCQSVSHHMQTSYRACQSVSHHMQTSYRVCQSVSQSVITCRPRSVDWRAQRPVSTRLACSLSPGIGIDDTFVMLAAWRRTSVRLPVPERMGRMLSDAAVSITITSVTDMISFWIGIISPFQSVRIFCIYSGKGQPVIVIIIIIIIIIISSSSSISDITFMQSIYNYMPETYHVRRVYDIAAVL